MGKVGIEIVLHLLFHVFFIVLVNYIFLILVFFFSMFSKHFQRFLAQNSIYSYDDRDLKYWKLTKHH